MTDTISMLASYQVDTDSFADALRRLADRIERGRVSVGTIDTGVECEPDEVAVGTLEIEYFVTSQDELIMTEDVFGTTEYKRD